MRISLITLALILWPLGIALTVAYWFVGDRVVRYVCRQEGRGYSILWPINPRWHFEMAELGWFTQAQAAGYGKVLIAIYAGFGLLFAVLLIALYGGVVDMKL